MEKESQKYEKVKRYLKKFEIIETDVELPIQDKVRGNLLPELEFG